MFRTTGKKIIINFFQLFSNREKSVIIVLTKISIPTGLIDNYVKINLQ